MVIGFVSFLVILFLFVQLFVSEYTNISFDAKPYQVLQSEAVRIGKTLASPSSPYDWVSITDIQKMGLLKEDTITNTTMAAYAGLPYSKSKLLLGTDRDYLFYFQEDKDLVFVDGQVYWGYNPDNFAGNGGDDFVALFSQVESLSSTLAKDERFVKLKVDNSSARIVRLIVYVWDP